LPTNRASGISGGEKTVPRIEEQALTKMVNATNPANASNAETQRPREARFSVEPILFSERNSIAALATGGTFADYPLASMRGARKGFVPDEKGFLSRRRNWRGTLVVSPNTFNHQSLVGMQFIGSGSAAASAAVRCALAPNRAAHTSTKRFVHSLSHDQPRGRAPHSHCMDSAKRAIAWLHFS
jgi:hypothetical protein